MIGRSGDGAEVLAGVMAGTTATGFGRLGAIGTLADRVTAIFVTSGLGVNGGAVGLAGATVCLGTGFAMGFGAGATAGLALIAMILAFTGVAAFFGAGLTAVRRPVAAMAFLRAGLRAFFVAFFANFLVVFLAVFLAVLLALFRPVFRAVFLRVARLARRALLRFFAAMVDSPT